MKQLKLTRLLILPFLIGISTIAKVQAVPIVYTSEVAWLAAVSGVVSEDFEGSAPGALAVGTVDIGLFSVTTNSNAEGANQIATGGSINGSQQLELDIDQDNNTIADFSAFDTGAINGFAGTWFSATTGDLLTIEINGTVIEFDNYLAGSGNGFLGFVDTTAFSTIIFDVENPSSSGEFFAVDNVMVSAAVPVPATLALIGLGMLGFTLRRK